MKDISFIEEISRRGEEAAEIVRSEFTGLAPAQLDWKPSGRSWSIGQCLDHLVTSNMLYFPTFQKIQGNEYKMTAWQRWNPLGIFFGRMLVDQMGEKVHRNLNSPAIFLPTSQPIDAAVVERFLKHQDTLLGFIAACRNADLDKTQITSPVSAFVTYSLRNAITIMVTHEFRHIGQAMRVKEHKEFPLLIL